MKMVYEPEYCCETLEQLVSEGVIVLNIRANGITAMLPYKNIVGYAVVHYCPSCGTKINK